MEACMPRLPVLLLGLLLGWLTACAHVGVRSDAQVAFEHGLSLFQRGQYAEAIPLLQEATQLDPILARPICIWAGRISIWGNGAMPFRSCGRRFASRRKPANTRSPSSCSMPCWEAPPPRSRLGASARRWAS